MSEDPISHEDDEEEDSGMVSTMEVASEGFAMYADVQNIAGELCCVFSVMDEEMSLNDW